MDFIDYYANLTEQEIYTYRTHYLNDQGEIMGLAQLLRQECRQEGMRTGEALALQKLLAKRFGTLPAAITDKCLTANLDDIERWFDRAIDAQQLSDVFDRH